jgi:hypothetical protein
VLDEAEEAQGRSGEQRDREQVVRARRVEKGLEAYVRGVDVVTPSEDEDKGMESEDEAAGSDENEDEDEDMGVVA